jgi:hypothetical protein
MKQQTTRRESFLERRSSATVRARRYPVPGEPSSETRLQAQRAREIDQPQSLALPRPRRVRLPCGHAPAGLHQSALPGDLQEHGARAGDVRARKPVPRAPTIVTPGQHTPCDFVTKLVAPGDALCEPILSDLYEPVLTNIGNGLLVLRGFEREGGAATVQEWRCEVVR